LKKEKRIWTIIDIIRWGADFFTEKGIDSPRLTIELILSFVLSYDRLQIYTQYDKPLSDDELARIKEAVLRRARREPLQYITGYTEFYGFKITVDENVLIPRPETETLVETIIKNHNVSQSLTILDIGCGSGCIAIALAKMLPNSQITAIDINCETIAIAQKNAELNEAQNITFGQVDILKAEPDSKFDVIVSNPPYISSQEFNTLELEVRYYEPKSALTDSSDGLTFYKRFAELFPKLLKENGKFYLEIGYGQAGDIKNIFKATGFNISIINDLAGIERVVIGSK
jgi:release factor glutamine methyltransferase